MSLGALRLATLMLAALSTGMAFCHLMEMPARMAWADTRLRWETGHAVNAVLQIAGLASLHASVLAEDRR